MQDPVSISVLSLLVYVAVFGTGGAYVAAQRGRPVNEGVILSLVFGPFGLIVVACLPPVDSRSPERTNVHGTYALCKECQKLKPGVMHGLCPECTAAINARGREATRTQEFLRHAEASPSKASPLPPQKRP